MPTCSCIAMESSGNESADDDQRFRYQPLANPGSSIRIIEVDPELSKEDTLQVQLFDSALSEEYTCLSYVWGQEDDGGGPFPIHINGKIFHIRHNLSNFLHVARRKYPKRRFWIDAICIDQGNTPERNHQVQQMGEIYSRAEEVIAWLGDDKLAADYIPRMNSRAIHTWRHVPGNYKDFLGTIARFVRSKFCSSLFGAGSPQIYPQIYVQEMALQKLIYEYWGRAWVTQEVTLAKHVRILVRETELDLTTLVHVKRQKYGSSDPYPDKLFEIYDANIGDHDTYDRHLLKLLFEYRFKGCENIRDRVFSLLSICVEGADLPVNYSLSEEKLLSTVLRTSRLTPCLCSATIAAQGIGDQGFPRKSIGPQYFVKFTVKATDVYTYHATRRKWPRCCSHFSMRYFTKRSDGQLFCLSNVCPKMLWHLFVVTEESNKQHIKAFTCYGHLGRRNSLDLGGNGQLVEICPSSDGNSYTIKLNLQTVLSLSTTITFTNRDKLSFYFRPYTDRFDWLGMCNVAGQTDGSSTVEYLDLGF